MNPDNSNNPDIANIYNPYWQYILKSYFKENGFVKHQIDSFNEFIEVGIQKILNEIGAIEIKTTKESRGGEATYVIEFGQISVKKPVIREHDGTTNILYPQEARNRNLTYHSSLYCDIKVKTIKNGEETFKISKEQLGYIPIMVRSKFCLLYNKTEKECKDLGECIYDEGGYFIVNGNEKAIVAQEKMPNNIIYCFFKKPPSKIIWQAEIRSQFEYHIKTTSTFYIRIFSKGARNTLNTNPTFTDIDGIRGQITYIKQDIPIIFIFYALGVTSKNEIIDIITNSKIPLDTSSDELYFKNIMKFLRCSFDEANEIIKEENGDEELDKTELQEFCLDYIGKKGSTIHGSKIERIKYAIQIINKELLPHLNLVYENIFELELQLTKTKAHFIGYMINKLYTSYLGIMKENDRDHLANKRLDLTGNLLTSLFKGIFKRLYKEAKVNLTKSIESNNSFDLMNNIKSKSITNDIKYALSTGNWGRQTGGTPPKTGVAQQLNRLTFSSGISHLRRVNTPLNREGKQAKPRQLHSTNWGYICSSETPEGSSCFSTGTTVLLENGNLVPIKNLEHNFKESSIFAVDINTRKSIPTDIVAFQNIDTEKFGKKILQITTKSGRNITVTDDHAFAVPNDTFTDAGKLKINDKVLVLPTAINQLQNEVPIVSILDKEKYMNNIKKHNLVSEITILKDIEKLESIGLLPIMNNDKKLPIIASLIGYCDTDGNISNSAAKFCMGCEEDMESLRTEAYNIGLGDVSNGKERKSTRTLTNGRIINETTWQVSLNAGLSRLLVALGAMVGRKTTQESKVPEFIKHCNLKVKSSYLSALFGGDGEALNYTKKNSSTRKSPRWSVVAPGFGNTKIESLTENLESYFTEIKNLLLEFGINSRNTINDSGAEQKKYNQTLEDEGKEIKVKRRFFIQSDFVNILKFTDNIGYKWCKQKQNKMRIVSEYVRYLQYYIDQTSIKRQQAHEMYHVLKMGPTEISKKLGIPLKRVEHMFYSKSYETMAIPRDYTKWPDFLVDTDADFLTGTLYDRIIEIKEIPYSECPTVMDLTTENENHTFVTGGFVTHNCGLLRNLAITCHVSIGSNKTFEILKNFFNKYTPDKFIEQREMTTDIMLYKIFLDGAWIISVDDKMVKFIVPKLVNMRRKLIISFDTCISLDKESKELHIFTGPGRFCRPLLVLENLHLLNEETKNYTWTELLINGIVEYIDIAEEEEIMIAMNMNDIKEHPNTYSHLEIHPSIILGVCTGSIPFSEHNQSPRNIYQSLGLNTLVTMADGTKKPIKNVQVGEMVVTFDHDTLSRSYSKVINQYVRPSENDMYKITTISGREIIATDNHSFFTNEGFKEVKHFDENTLIGIDMKANQEYVNEKVKILDREHFINTCRLYKYTEKTIEKYTNELNKWFEEIDVNKVAILAGIIGYLLADGTLFESYGRLIVSFCHSNEESAITLQNDLELLGFYRNKIRKQIQTSIFGKNTDNPREITQTGYVHTYSTAFSILLGSLKITVGKRTTQSSSIPDFILNGHKEVKRSFLSGIFGGDGSRIGYSKRHTGDYIYNIGALSMSKVPEHVESLKEMFKNIADMLKLFDVKTGSITVYEGKFDKLEVNLPPSQSSENVIKFFEEIGFKYDTYKNQSSGIVVEYLKYKDRKYDLRYNDVMTIRKKIDNGSDNKTIANEHNLKISTINNLRVTYKKGGIIKVRHGFKDYMTIDNFIKSIVYIPGTNTIFIPIEKIEKYTENNMIADITVENQTNHDFMANSVLSSNSSMMKQSTGIYASNFNERFDTISHILHYPQKPLVHTVFSNYMRYKELPAGINAIVAIACYGGYNQEDSIIVNKGALDRGIFRSTYFKTYVDQEKEIVRVGGLMEQFEIPNRNETKGIQHGNYGKLGPDGVIEPGTRVIENDIIIGKTTPIATSKQEISQIKKFKKRDVSTSMRQNEAGVVDKVLITTNSDGLKYSKVKIRSTRIPETGDKLASLHGQKGTIGMIYRQEDMPFTEDGIVPDLIINPHAIPSRMTIGHLIECLLGKVCTITGKEGDSTPFNGIQVAEVSKMLENCGYAGDGTEVLYNGETGEPMEARIFIGPTYYQRLKHMVKDKEHCLTMDHEVLTIEGWKLFNDLTDNDLVATLVNDNEVVFEKPTKLMSFPDYEGNIYEILNDEVDLKMTEEHRIYTLNDGRWDLVPIKDCWNSEFTMKTVNKTCPEIIIKPFDMKITYTKCPVFCLQVPSEVFYVRRNGKSLWTGNSRSTGPVTKLTRQPLEGRAKDGGLKLGEMERDVLCSHGAAFLLKDRMFYNSDPYRIHVCKLCGTICQADLDKQRFLCKCIKGGNTTEVAQVYIPYACKLFFQELMAMSIIPRIKF